MPEAEQNGKMVKTPSACVTGGRRCWRRNIRKLFSCLVMIMVSALLYLVLFGFPGWATERLARKLSEGPYRFSIEKVKLDLLNGLEFKNVQIFRKRVVGPPFLEAKELHLRYGRHSFRDGRSGISHVAVRDGIVRLTMLSVSEEKQEQQGADGKPVTLDIEIENCEVSGIPVVDMTATYAGSADGFEIRGMSGLIGRDVESRGAMRGAVRYDSKAGLVTGTLDTGFDPAYLTNYLSEVDMPFTIDLIGRFAWHGRPPVIATTFRRSMAPDHDFYSESLYVASDFQYQGADVTRSEGRVIVNYLEGNSFTEINPIRVERPEGYAQGGFRIDTKDKMVIFDVVSSVDPRKVFQMIELFTPDEMKAWRFDGPVKIVTRGRVDYRDGERTEFAAAVDGQGMGYDRLTTETCTFRMAMSGFTNSVSDIKGTAYGGTFSGLATFLLPRGEQTNISYNADISVQGADFGRVAKSFSAREPVDVSGKMDLTLKWQGILADASLSSLKGNGAFAIKKGKVFSVPLFGGLSNLLGKIIPGLDFVMRQSDMRMDLDIRDGKILSSAAKIEGDVLSLRGKGEYSFAGNLNYGVELTLMREHTLVAKLLRVVTYPISKLLEFRLTGTLDEPSWYPVNFSSDILEKLGLRKNSDEVKPEPVSGSVQ